MVFHCFFQFEFDFFPNYELRKNFVLRFIDLSYLGIPPVLYLTMNQTIQQDTKELILQLLRVNLNRLSHETRAECRVAGLEKCAGNDEENIEAPIEMREIGGTHNQSN